MFLGIIAAIVAIYGFISVVLALLFGRFMGRNKRRAEEALAERHLEQAQPDPLPAAEAEETKAECPLSGTGTR